MHIGQSLCGHTFENEKMCSSLQSGSLLGSFSQGAASFGFQKEEPNLKNYPHARSMLLAWP